MSVGSIQSLNPGNSLSELSKFNPYFASKFYRATREIQHNTILNRATVELLGADLPTTLTELVGRNWKTAVEVFFRITLFLVTSFFIPLLFIPILNKVAAKKFDLPKGFQKHFYNQFEDLTPEKDNPADNDQFKEKVVVLEGNDKVKSYLIGDKRIQEQKIKDYKKKLLDAKTYVMKLDILFSGLLTYLVPWVQVWFSKKILGVVGYTGETDLLSESQQEESARFYEKTKYLRFAFGLIPTVFGSNWYSNTVKRVATKKDVDLKNSKFESFIKKNIKQFDYYKEIYANKLNLAGTFLFGGDFGFLLTSRSLNEFIERCLRLAVFWPTMFLGVEWVNYKLCESHDKKNGTKIVDYERPKELWIKPVKSLEKLEEELLEANIQNNTKKVNKATNAIKTQVKNYWLSILLDSLLMGVGLTAANIIGTKMRVRRGIY